MGPLAWESAEAEALSAFTPLGTLELGPGQAPTRLRFSRRAALGFVIRRDEALVVDERLRHPDRPYCVDPETLGVEATEARRGDCQEGRVSLDRGRLQLDGLVDVAIDEERLEAWLISTFGEVQRVDLDPASGVDWLRPGELLELDDLFRSGVVSDGALYLSSIGGVLYRLGEDGALIEQERSAYMELLSGEGGLFYVDALGLRAPGLDAPLPAHPAAAAGGLGVAYNEGVLRWTDGREVNFTKSPDDLAIDPRTGVAWVLVDDALWRITPDGEQSYETIGNVDVFGISHTHDIWTIDADGRLTARLDALPLADGRPPLQLTSLSFLETPRSREDEILCDAPRLDGALSQGLDRAEPNVALMSDLPGVFAIGVTPRVAEAALHCRLERRLAEALEGPWESGLLMHDASGCADEACYAGFVAERLGRLRAAGLSPTWVGGATADSSEGFDVVGVTAGLGLDRRLFLSQGLHAEVQPLDPLFKEPWPLLPGDPPTAFLASSALPTEGAQALYPGDPVRGFVAASCAGLMVQECILLSQGSDQLSEADVDALFILALHAAARRAGEVSTWSWHWPDLTAWDYTAGCVRGEGGLWAAEEAGCQATQVQALAWRLHQRLVLNGVAVWAGPSELGWPE